MNSQDLTLAASQETAKESHRLEQQFADLQTRRDNWSTQAEQAERSLIEAREKALTGDTASPEEITTAQSERDALYGLVRQADSQLSGLSAKLQTARAMEARTATVRHIQELNEKRTKNIASHDVRLTALDTFLRTSIAELSDDYQLEADLCREIALLGGVPAPAPLGTRRWSDSGLKYARNIALMLAEKQREEEKLADEHRRIRGRERAA